jgi:hypothetical protein
MKNNANHHLFSRLQSIGSDEEGHLMLGMGVMSFFLVIVFVFMMHAHAGIKRRMEMQNAVDSAAVSAALWQARGCNLMQILNNVRYRINEGAAYTMMAIEVSCYVAGGCAVCSFIPISAPVCKPCHEAACMICPFLDEVDYIQYVLDKTLYYVQRAVPPSFTALSVYSANETARQNGAEGLVFSVLPHAVGDISTALKQSPADLPENSDHYSKLVMPENFGLDFYAVPINIGDMMNLGITENKDCNQFPWSHEPHPGAAEVGGVACLISVSSKPTREAGKIVINSLLNAAENVLQKAISDFLMDQLEDGVKSIVNGADIGMNQSVEDFSWNPEAVAKKENTNSWEDLAGLANSLMDPPPKPTRGDEMYGWDSTPVFEGNPGFVTWMAASSGGEDLLGIGSIPWLRAPYNVWTDTERFTGRPADGNPTNSPFSTTPDIWSEEKDSGYSRGNAANDLRLPYHFVFATSQIDGTPVVPDFAKADAKPRLIPVRWKDFSLKGNKNKGASAAKSGGPWVVYH